MKYADLVQFDPVESVKVLTDADDLDQAREDVRTFVISDDMAKKLAGVIFPNLQFEKPTDQKGIQIVANYGTGKTHLMSLISAVAERAELRDEIANDLTKEHAGSIAGQFKVIRAEIGATEMSLLEIVTSQIESGLADLGIDFEFAAADKASGLKQQIEKMMGVVEAKYPGMGLLYVLDELLDYLRGRKDTELIKDLAVLRELGEICRSTRFRIIVGLQEALYGNPRFANVANEVKRVHERYEQARIARGDVGFVVEQRLLRKSQQQKDLVRAHLEDFAPMYEGMSERMDEYVSLYPVHPKYLDVFELLTVIEKREILKTLSREIGAILDDDVPDNETGIVSFDAYRGRLADDPVFRTIEDVSLVLNRSDVLRTKVQSGLASKQYVPTALRIIDGLTVYRLATSDVKAELGLTAAELRDDLCLLPAGLPEKYAVFLGITITSILSEVMTAVNGQYISEDPESGQYYLDLQKDTDFEQLIADRAGSLDESKLDVGYFRALEEVLGLRDASYVSGFRIWEYELPWQDKKVLRPGYLFMGVPNERSTAHPSRDFYLYFLQPYDPPAFNDAEKPDEVMLRLDPSDDEFTGDLRTYAGATALAEETAKAQHRQIYDDKARKALQEMVAWLRTNMRTAITITHAGEEKTLGEWLGVAVGPRADVKEQIDSIAAQALGAHFESRCPGYPQFDVESPIGRKNLDDSVAAALSQLSGRKTSLGTRILSSLELLDASGDVVASGTFASKLEAEVKAGGEKVLNRKDLLVERDPDVWTWGDWHLEPEWVVVIAAALAHQGRMQIGYPSGQVDALTLSRLGSMSLSELGQFKYLAPPKGIPVVTLKQVAKLLDVPEGIVGDGGVTPDAVKMILNANAELLKRVVDAQGELHQGMNLWGESVAGDVEKRGKRLDELQSLLDDVKARDSVGKMNRLEIEPERIDSAKVGIGELAWIEAAVRARQALSDNVEFLREASEVFGDEHELSVEAGSLRNDVIDVFRATDPIQAADTNALKTTATQLRKRFSAEAAAAHSRDKLDGEGDERKRQIIEGATFQDLNKLSVVSILPSGAFGSIQGQLVDIGVCKTFDKDDLKRSVICPECKYRPKAADSPTARAKVDAIDGLVADLYSEWESTLIDNLRAEEMGDQIALLKPDRKTMVEELLTSEQLPDEVDDALVAALNEVFGRFEVRRVSPEETWNALFPDHAPSTITEVRERFGVYIAGIIAGANADRVRVVPSTNEEDSE